MKKFICILLLTFCFLGCKGIDFNIYEEGDDIPPNIIYSVQGQSRDLIVSYMLYNEIITVLNPELPYEVVLLKNQFEYPFRIEAETFYSRDYLTVCVNETCASISGEDSVVLTQKIEEK